MLARERLVASGTRAAEVDAIDAEAHAEIEAALAVADAAPWPQASDAFEDVVTTGAGTWR